VKSWWNELSGPAKFRLYSQLTLQSAIVVVAVAAATATFGVPWSVAAILAASIAALLAVQAQPELAMWTKAAVRGWALPTAVAILLVVWLACIVVARVASDDADIDAARTVGVFAALFATMSIVPFVRHKWWVVLAVSLATGLAFGTSPAAALRVAAVVLVAGCFITGTTLLTLWGMRVVDELDRAKSVEARLQVAEERLRFSRDLHDVVGRSFSAIAVKSELAATLSRAGAAERAATEMDEVKAVAVESMDQMRDLVRGYRDVDFDGEVAGARSLLEAAGCRLVVEGDPAKVPTRFHEVAAWVVREGTTNIVKHSSATSATLALGRSGMSLRNNGVHTDHTVDSTEHSGLRGLTERLAPVGASLEITTSGDTFVLEIRWENQ
jgi:two-component system sensor histidine kinase DesK